MRSRVVAVAVAALAVAGCGAGPTEAPAPAPDAEAPREWTAELRSNEAGATKRAFFDALAAGAVAGVADGFLGDDLVARRGARTEVAAGGTRTVWSGPSSPVDAAGFGEAAARWRAGWSTIEGRDTHTWEVGLGDGGRGLTTLEHVRFFGTAPGDRRREDRVHLELGWTRAADGWAVSRAIVREAWTLTAPVGAFVDVTDRVLPPGYDQAGAAMYTDAGPALADADGDGDIDLFLPRMHAPARLYLNDGGYFEDATEPSGLALAALSEGTNTGLFIDHDADGDLDLVVGDRDAGVHLLLRDGARYRPHPASPFGGPGPWESLAAADYDGDGAVDVFVCGYGVIDADRQPESYVDARDGHPNLLLRNVGDAGFRDATEAAGLTAHARRWSYAAAWADYDRDGDPDLYVADDYGPNLLLRNDGGRFTDVATAAGAEDRGNGMSVAWFDADGDGTLDLYVSNMQSFAGNRLTRSRDFPGSPEQVALYSRFAQGNTLLRGRGDGTFEDVTVASGAKPAYWAWGAVPFDHDADGDQDLLCVTGMYTGPTSGDT